MDSTSAAGGGRGSDLRLLIAHMYVENISPACMVISSKISVILELGWASASNGGGEQHMMLQHAIISELCSLL